MKALVLLLGIAAVLALSSPAMAQFDITKLPRASAKKSIDDLGAAGLDNLRSVGRGYGQQICAAKEISAKQDIKPKAWPKIKRSCGKFTFGLLPSFSDDPNRIFSLCIGAALDGCQRAIGIEAPCRDLTSCQALLGVP